MLELVEVIEVVVIVDWSGGDEAEADELVEGEGKLAACCLPCLIH